MKTLRPGNITLSFHPPSLPLFLTVSLHRWVRPRVVQRQLTSWGVPSRAKSGSRHCAPATGISLLCSDSFFVICNADNSFDIKRARMEMMATMMKMRRRLEISSSSSSSGEQPPAPTTGLFLLSPRPSQQPDHVEEDFKWNITFPLLPSRPRNSETWECWKLEKLYVSPLKLGYSRSPDVWQFVTRNGKTMQPATCQCGSMPGCWLSTCCSHRSYLPLAPDEGAPIYLPACWSPCWSPCRYTWRHRIESDHILAEEVIRYAATSGF